MRYEFSTDIRDDEKLRESFNVLTEQTFCFNFKEWYERGEWGNKYIPHVLVDNGRVISNVSVNLMTFNIDGVIHKFIQLGTVMTAKEYRGQGLNKYIIEQIFEEYEGKTEGMYLFGNDSVLEYYPKFGFEAIEEYAYSRKVNRTCTAGNGTGLRVIKADKNDSNIWNKLIAKIKLCNASQISQNQNDGMHMIDNYGLYMFWLKGEYSDKLYYLPEQDAFVILTVEGNELVITQILGNEKVDLDMLALSFGEQISEIRLEYTPADKKMYQVNIHKVEDRTIFIKGEKMKLIKSGKLVFPELSHA